MNRKRSEEPELPERELPRAHVPLVADDAAEDFVKFIHRRILDEAVNYAEEHELTWLNPHDKYPLTPTEHRDGHVEFFDLARDWLETGAATYYCPTYEAYLLAVIQCLGRLSNDGRLRQDTAGDLGNPTVWWIRVFEEEPPSEGLNAWAFRLQRNSRPAALDREQFYAVKHQLEMKDRLRDSRVIKEIATKVGVPFLPSSAQERWEDRAATTIA